MGNFHSTICHLRTPSSNVQAPGSSDIELGASELQPTASTTRIESYKPGYPRFSALIAANSFYFVCRRYLRLRARILLNKQDYIYTLEQRLDRIDREETRRLFLGTRRRDVNLERRAVLLQIESGLKDYGVNIHAFVESTRRILRVDRAIPRDIESLRNWLDGTSCLSRDETAYLLNEKDLMNLAPSGDSATKILEDWVEDQFIRFHPGFRMSSIHDESDDPDVYISSGPLIRGTARAVMLCISLFLLLIPIVICIFVQSMAARIVIIACFTILYLSIVTWLTNPKMIELILAGATFATILTVFVS